MNKNSPKKSNKNPKTPHGYKPPSSKGSLFYAIIFLFLVLGSYYILNPGALTQAESEEVAISKMVQLYEKQELKKVEIRNGRIQAETKEDKKIFSIRPEGESLKDLGLSDSKNPTEVKAISNTTSQIWISILSNWVPILLLIGIMLFAMKQLGKGANNALSFGKSRAKAYSKNGKTKTTFKDVAGMDEAKEDLVEVVDFLKNSSKYTKMGAKIPRGVMLIGAPGTGKTLLARAVAGEANVPFFNISGSEFVEMFVGVGASRVRDLFEKAKKNAPCIIFIDEIDAVGRQRGFGIGGGHDEREQTLNQILTEMDGFEKDNNVIVIAATNRPDVLDAALTRPGRFDRRVIIDMPNLKERGEILKVHTRNKPMDKKVDLSKVAKQTPGFSGADLENLVNEAAILAAKDNRKTIEQYDLEMAIEKVGLGPEKKSRKLSDQEKKITAYHEVGHALVGKLLPGCDPIHKVTIIPRGMALGVTWSLPQEDIHLKSISRFKDEICSLLGGYVAEKVFFKEVTTGASSDLKRATAIARAMVTQYGMSEDIGLMIFGEQKGSQYLGTETGYSKNYSEEMAYKIDQAIGKIIAEAQKRTTDIIQKNSEMMHKISEALLKKEVLNDVEFNAFFDEKKPKKDK